MQFSEDLKRCCICNEVKQLRLFANRFKCESCRDRPTRIRKQRETTEMERMERMERLLAENKQLKIRMNLLQSKHNALLRKRQYHKFKRGPVFYIISDADTNSVKFKVGIDDCDVNVRLQQHRSTTPAIKLEYLIYTDRNRILETVILQRFMAKRDFKNHEWIYDVELDDIVSSVAELVRFLCVEVTQETELHNYNKDIISYKII
jgi:hypothetical protein